MLASMSFSSVHAMGMKNNDSQSEISVDIVYEKIHQYLTTHCLSPYIPPCKGEFTLTGRIQNNLETDTKIINFFGGQFLLQNSSPHALFMAVQDKKTADVVITLLFLTNGTIMSPTLFFNIVNGPELNCCSSQAIELLNKGAHIYMDVLKEEPGKSLQKWTFFTPHESCHVKIVTKDDGQGKTYYSVFKK